MGKIDELKYVIFDETCCESGVLEDAYQYDVLTAFALFRAAASSGLNDN